MKVNSLINEISRGVWAMSFDGIASYAPFAQKLMTGQEIKLGEANTSAMLSVFDKDMRVVPQEDEQLDVPPGSTAVINMMGPLISYGDWCVYGADDYIRAMDLVESNPNFIGGVTYMNGPGGAVSAISPFKYFGLRRNKIWGTLYEQCCSAYLYAAYLFSDFVMAENDISAMIGCLGVVLSYKDNREYLKSQGFVLHEIYPEESEDKNLAIRLALEGNYDMIKTEMLSPLAVKFQNVAISARPKLVKAPGVLTGKTFYSEQALEYNMIDGIGNLETAIARVQMMHEMKSLYKK